MPRLDEIMRRTANPPGVDPAATHGGWAAEITAVTADGVFVIVPGYSPDHVYGPLAYAAAAGEPAVGDACVAVFTDDRDPFVIVPGVGESWGPWTALAFEAGGVWANSPVNVPPFPPLQYRVSSGGDVQLRGRPVVQAAHSFTPGGTGATIATLPAAACPAYRKSHSVSALDSTLGNTTVQVAVNPAGTIVATSDDTGRTLGAAAGTAIRLGLLGWSVLP